MMDWREFTQYIGGRIAAHYGERVKVEYEWGDSLEDSILCADFAAGRRFACYMGNHYLQYRQFPEHLAQIEQTIIASLSDFAQERTTDSGQILPIIRSRAWLEELRANIEANQGGSMEESLMLRPLVGDCLLLYALDYEHGMQILLKSHAQSLGLAVQDLPALALDNLRTYAAAREIGYGRAETAAVFQMTLDETYDSSLLLLFGDMMAGIGHKPQAEYAVAVPSRDCLLFCSAQDGEAVAALRHFVRSRFEEAAYPLSPEIYRYRQGTLSIWQTLQ